MYLSACVSVLVYACVLCHCMFTVNVSCRAQVVLPFTDRHNLHILQVPAGPGGQCSAVVDAVYIRTEHGEAPAGRMNCTQVRNAALEVPSWKISN